MEPVEVTLSREEMAMAGLVGAMRRWQAVELGARDRAGSGMMGEGPLCNDVNGAGGEIAAAKYFGLYWGGQIGNGPDLGKRLQVRTRRDHGYELVVQDTVKDKDDDIFILVTGVAPHYKLWGWIRGREAKRPEWRKSYGGGYPAFYVPKEAMHPLPDHVMAREVPT